MRDEYKIQEVFTEICNLKCSLESVASDFGDWKIAKNQEYIQVGLEPPYDIQELHQKRQAVRDRINELEQELAELEAATDEE